ncbi:response regulator with CheY-like receiver domain and winged-helix DNA-binding domain [Beggiatoa alba B18LD]|uniref:Response regulator with CheY-like receiver domain and winged-helix DNA-binding domain n=1 Tax=Beggiatoa alba B18LD TaxID=395493 RepID=I3CKJ8_9GAMM|nr:response regulator [Beggiatoa alba]EIJ44141.1 response regulator with CheY-like receiver domain and winged-helix DNA-binding domain [Beggiatoa alba B18LD]
MENTQRTILIVEDEPKLAHLLEDYLHQAGFITHWLADGALVLPWCEQNSVDLIILDLMLPNKDGIEICRELRRTSHIPIMMATARVEEIDRLLGLELGADDYICKPYSLREVIARVRAILRRVTQVQATLEDPQTGFVIDEERYTIHYQGHALDLTPAEFRLLSTLLSASGRVYSRSQLLDRLYEDNRIVTDRTVDSHIKNLRKKLAELAPDTEMIRSIYGVGYKIEL